MEGAMTTLIALAGLMFSISIALLVEELALGKMFQLIFVRSERVRKRKTEERYVAD